MGQFAKLSDYKYNVMSKLITNTDLVKALVCNDEDFLSYDLSNFDSTSLIYTQIFPCQYVINISDTPLSYITMSFGNYKYVNNCFKSGLLTLFIFTFKSLMKTNCGLRTDFILDKVDTMFNQKKEVGDFSLELYSGGDFKVNDDYSGSMISYKFIDFSK